ncbi:MAG: hypothetical protein O6949_02005 [Chloroflexi bacterium]|nr:hypothetical protein [Chloroflexota bacterium]
MEVVAINLVPQYNTLEEWQAFLEEFGAVDFVWAADTFDQRAVQTYNVQSLGTTIIIDREGQLVYRDEAASSYKMLETAVLAALN